MDAPLTPLDGMTPIVLADLMLTAPLRRRANMVILQPGGGGRYHLMVKRGSLNLLTNLLGAVCLTIPKFVTSLPQWIGGRVAGVKPSRISSVPWSLIHAMAIPS